VIWRGTCSFSSLSLFLFLVLIIGLNERSELPTTCHTHLIFASRSLRQIGYGGSSHRHSFPIQSPQDADSLLTLLALMWGGAGTPATILLPMTMGELKA
jgi:hypothetical protein